MFIILSEDILELLVEMRRVHKHLRTDQNLGPVRITVFKKYYFCPGGLAAAHLVSQRPSQFQHRDSELGTSHFSLELGSLPN